jgi:hypothetical protein
MAYNVHMLAKIAEDVLVTLLTKLTLLTLPKTLRHLSLQLQPKMLPLMLMLTLENKPLLNGLLISMLVEVLLNLLNSKLQYYIPLVLTKEILTNGVVKLLL